MDVHVRFASGFSSNPDAVLTQIAKRRLLSRTLDRVLSVPRFFHSFSFFVAEDIGNHWETQVKES